MADSESIPKSISRKEAKARGLRFYFTGRPCPRGHIALRYVSALACRDCLMSEETMRSARVRSKKWYIKNRERQIKKSAKWWSDNKLWAMPKHSIRTKRWWKKNPHKRRIYNHNRRAQEHGNGGTYAVADILALYRKQRGKCRFCKTKLDWVFHVDHVIPISKGGRNDATNLQVLCKSCNLKKSDKLRFASQQ